MQKPIYRSSNSAPADSRYSYAHCLILKINIFSWVLCKIKINPSFLMYDSIYTRISIMDERPQLFYVKRPLVAFHEDFC